MPADHLTTTPLTTGVLTTSLQRVLAGAPLTATATAAGVDPVDLADAIGIYHTAGLAAVRQHTENRWRQVRITFPDWDTAEVTAARTLGPRLDQLRDTGAIEDWWFLRKHPSWRLRFAGRHITAAHRVLDELTAAGTIRSWWPTMYEPETAAFGGPAGLHSAHDLFCADSRGALDYLRQPQPALGRRELSLLLLGGLLQAADLDWFERGDVFARLAQVRPAPDVTHDIRTHALTGNVRGLLAAPTDAIDALFTPDGAVGFAGPWRAAFTATGHRLAQAAAAGHLQRGLRSVLSHIVIFHWNRIGLSANTQAILTRAAHDAFLPRS